MYMYFHSSFILTPQFTNSQADKPKNKNTIKYHYFEFYFSTSLPFCGCSTDYELRSFTDMEKTYESVLWIIPLNTFEEYLRV